MHSPGSFASAGLIVLLVAACHSPTTPSRTAPTPLPSPERTPPPEWVPSPEWTLTLDVACKPVLNQLCKAYARKGAQSSLDFVVVNSGDILAGPHVGANVSVFIDVDQNPSTRYYGLVNDIGADLYARVGPEGTSPGTRVGHNAVMFSTSQLDDLPPGHDSVDIVFKCLDESLTDEQTAPAQGHVTYRFK